VYGIGWYSLCIAVRLRRLFQTRRLIETRLLIEVLRLFDYGFDVNMHDVIFDADGGGQWETGTCHRSLSPLQRTAANQTSRSATDTSVRYIVHSDWLSNCV